MRGGGELRAARCRDRARRSQHGSRPVPRVRARRALRLDELGLRGLQLVRGRRRIGPLEAQAPAAVAGRIRAIVPRAAGKGGRPASRRPRRSARSYSINSGSQRPSFFSSSFVSRPGRKNVSAASAAPTLHGVELKVGTALALPGDIESSCMTRSSGLRILVIVTAYMLSLDRGYFAGYCG